MSKRNDFAYRNRDSPAAMASRVLTLLAGISHEQQLLGFPFLLSGSADAFVGGNKIRSSFLDIIHDQFSDP
jgi:hypothetical protein